jgi:hypothetical protein
MENDDPIVLELEARFAEAASLGSEASLTEIRSRTLATLEPLFFDRVADELDRVGGPHPMIDALRDRADRLRIQQPPLPRRETE